VSTAVKLSRTVTSDAAGLNLIDPDAVTLTLTNTAGTVALTKSWPGTLTRESTGKFSTIITAPADVPAGLYVEKWQVTNPTLTATDWVELADDVPGLLTLTAAKEALQKTSTKRANDAELQVYVDAVNEWIRNKAGPVIPETRTDPVTVNQRTGLLRLPVQPVLAVISATYAGVSTSIAGWPTVYEDGKVYVSNPYTYRTPTTGAGLEVTYRVGRTSVPASLVTAARELVVHLWRSQREQFAAPTPGGFADETVTIGGMAYAVPNRVAQLVEPYALDAVPGVA
jgi:hypothetical protein